MLQALKTQLAICPTVFRNRELPIFRYTYILIPFRDVYKPFVDDEGWNGVSSCADPLDDCYPLSIAWLDNFRLRSSFGTSDDLQGRSNTHLKASFIEVLYVIVVDAVLGFSILKQLEPRVDNLRIFWEFPLVVFGQLKAIMSSLELVTGFLAHHLPIASPPGTGKSLFAISATSHNWRANPGEFRSRIYRTTICSSV